MHPKDSLKRIIGSFGGTFVWIGKRTLCRKLSIGHRQSSSKYVRCSRSWQLTMTKLWHDIILQNYSWLILRRHNYCVAYDFGVAVDMNNRFVAWLLHIWVFSNRQHREYFCVPCRWMHWPANILAFFSILRARPAAHDGVRWSAVEDTGRLCRQSDRTHPFTFASKLTRYLPRGEVIFIKI